MCRAVHAKGQPQPHGPGQPLLSRWGQIWENICSDKASASRGRGQARAHHLLQPTTMGCSRGLPVPPPPHTEHGKGQTLGLMAWKPTGHWRVGGCLMTLAPNRRLSELIHRPQDSPVTPQRLPCPLPVPRAPAVTQGLPQPCTRLPLTTKCSIKLGWKPGYAPAREEAEVILGGLG